MVFKVYYLAFKDWRMFGFSGRQRTGGLCFSTMSVWFDLVLLGVLAVSEVPLCLASYKDKQPGQGIPKVNYIGLDEIAPGMDGYCLTVYEGTEVEKFNVRVLSVIRNMTAGRDAILVEGTDERFIHTGPVAGCSGSPVYIKGRLAGALAFGWTFSKDPLYGVTPIEEMLEVGDMAEAQQASRAGDGTGPGGEGGYVFDFSRPVDFAEVNQRLSAAASVMLPGRCGTPGAGFLPCPLVTSGLPETVCRQLNESVQGFGLMAVSGIAGRGAETAGSEQLKLVPGGVLAVPLVTGDIEMTVVGTVTEVVGDKVYGFGHSFLGYGPVNLPIATGTVHTVVSNTARSFKVASAVNIVGALTLDESAAVYGQIGAQAKMFPLTMTVSRYNDVRKRVYNCRVADNRVLSPFLLRTSVTGAILNKGNLPPDHTVEYRGSIELEGERKIEFNNISTGTGPDQVANEGTGTIAMLMNNPFEKVTVKSVDFDIRISAEKALSRIWSVSLSDTEVKPGEKVDVEITLQSVLAEKKKYGCSYTIPAQLKPGRYELIVCGADDYENFLKKAIPYRFTADSLPELIDVLNFSLNIARDRLYCLLVLPPGGVAVEKAELPDLPATKALVLADAKRGLQTWPYQHWLEKSFDTGTFVADKKIMYITVEEQ